MPRIKVQDIDLYYEIHGEGYPMVLIRGLGSNADHWYTQTPVFSSRYRVVSFDNRGIGRSDKPNEPYTISMMADDTVGLMDALGISRAHILALSMGGMIAQEIALKYPEKVESLVLACTHCGGKHAISASEEISVIFLILFLWARGWRIVWRYSSRFKTGPHLSHCTAVSTLIYYQAIRELSGLKVPPMLFLPMRSEF